MCHINTISSWVRAVCFCAELVFEVAFPLTVRHISLRHSFFDNGLRCTAEFPTFHLSVIAGWAIAGYMIGSYEANALKDYEALIQKFKDRRRSLVAAGMLCHKAVHITTSYSESRCLLHGRDFAAICVNAMH